MKFINNNNIFKYFEDGNYDKAFDEPIQKSNISKEGRLEEFLFNAKQSGNDKIESTGVVGMSLADFIYDWVRFNPDPKILQGIDYARTGIDFSKAEELSNILNFSRFAESIMDGSKESIKGDISQLQGYVAERFAAWELTNNNYEVSFPADSNQEGWDILVDGSKFQVKCLSSTAGVYEHLRNHPDIPVIVNVELGEKLQGIENVHIGSYSYETIVEGTEETLIHGADILDFEIPWISLMVSSGVNLISLIKNEEELKHAITNIFTDVSGRWATSVLGEKACGLVGLMLFGPAGAIIGSGFGTIFGAYHGKSITKLARSMLLKNIEHEIYTEMSNILKTASNHIDYKLDAKLKNLDIFKNSLKKSSKANNTLLDKITNKNADECSYYKNKKTEMLGMAENPKNIGKDIFESVETLLVTIKRSAVHQQHIQNNLKNLFKLINKLQEESKKLKLV